jgi:hypothetical protein
MLKSLLRVTALAAELFWLASVNLAEDTVATPAAAIAKADLFVAPDGNDSNPGSVAAPLATLAKARNVVRRKVADGLKGDVLVLIRGGTYQQTDTLLFGSDDSGTEKYSITYAAYPGEKVVLSGGRKITGWKKGAGEIWTAEVPEVRAGNWYFRQLFVNSTRAIRARTPNTDDQTKIPWWHIRTSSAKVDAMPPEDALITASVTGPIKVYNHPNDIELVYIANNAGSRKLLGAINEKDQTFTLPGPHHWNPVQFGSEWQLSVPSEGKACYLENALEFLDQPGEWYLDRQSGVLSYWPRAGEDLTRAEVVAPVAHNTILAVLGTAERPITNLHFKGIHLEYVEWPVPSWGYLGMFCCNVPVPNGNGTSPGHRFTDAVVEYRHARRCNFTDGGIAHAGAMGLCLRQGTAFNVIEGNEICDLGGGGIGLGYPNVAYCYLNAAPPPETNEYKGYRIANNHIHHCGVVDYGAVGITLFSSQDSVVAHNLIHDIAYIGIAFAGSQDPRMPFARNNTVEYNHIFNAMKVTVDGAALYVTFAQHGVGGFVRGNLVHDCVPNHFNTRPRAIEQFIAFSAAGVYLDADRRGAQYEFNHGYRYECNVAYRTSGALVCNCTGVQDNRWNDNVFLNQGAPPREFTEAMQGFVGLEPAYRRTLLNSESAASDYHILTEDTSRDDVWSGYQFHCRKTGDGAVAVFRRDQARSESSRLKLRSLDAKASYQLKLTTASIPKDLLATPPQLDAESALVTGETQRTGQQLMENGLVLKAPPAQVIWITYHRM